jgi:hypothetical protein
MALATACILPLGNAIAKLSTWSAPMANYVNNGKQQERVADDAAVVQH